MLLIIIFLVLLLALGGWVGFLHYRFLKITQANKALLKEAGGSNLEEILHLQNKNISRLKEQIKDLDLLVKIVQKKIGFKIQRVNLLRYDAFQEKGGAQSYSIAFLDEHQNGLLLSNLHTREGDRLYAKTLSEGQSKYHLTQEELSVINQIKEGESEQGGLSLTSLNSTIL